MTQVTNELMYEILKQLQAGQGEIKAILLDQQRQLIKVRAKTSIRCGATTCAP
jgi:hypothetical protein